MEHTITKEPEIVRATQQSWFVKNILLGQSPDEYLRGLITPFNIIVAIILSVGLPLTWIRFTQGIGSVSNLNDANPWGLWIGVDVLCGVALASGGFIIGTAVYLFGMDKYKPIVRPAILTGFLGYAFVVVGLSFDLGQPWRLPYPMFVSYGVTLGDVFSRLARGDLLIGSVHRIQPRSFRMAGPEENQEICYRIDNRSDGFWSNIIDAASISAGCVVFDGGRKIASSLVHTHITTVVSIISDIGRLPHGYI